ncbi:hypothetical protein DBR32_15420 [Taibaiella sp. KBW10]|uniref:hypothetical protein n=1 Tax=Taibaiella sp. KBW10 TaxID=2153357 RepID=UPI000F5B529B|nr:hypothetical protein [Taibaiella sp. KBW10]RQO29646.1 hypothetical protein DBR32_15420 [Taibaiella sp. KBW10]
MTDIHNLSQRWSALETMMTERFGKLPDMQALLYLIGINEYTGQTPEAGFSKEQKQDLMHVAVCTLLSKGGYYLPTGIDEEGWPHFKELIPVPENTLDGQETLLKAYILQYFDL